MNPNPDLLAELLKATSRSFYLSLRVLPTAMRPAAGVGYLLCRTADSIADTDVLPTPDRLRFLNSFFDLIDRFPGRTEEWAKFSNDLAALNQQAKSDEGRLLTHLPNAIAYLHDLSKTDQVLVQRVVQGVIQGMRLDLKTFGDGQQGVAAFKNRDMLENYLNWVGGEPGRFWTDLTQVHHPRLAIPNVDQWREDGIRFGTGLQMVNILRDLSSDLARGRCYLPLDLLNEQGLSLESLKEPEAHTRLLPLIHRLIDGTLDRLEHGIRYLRTLPRSMVSLRLAVWWPLALGLQTMTRLRRSYFILDPKKRVKVPRVVVYGTMAGSVPLIFSNGAMESMFRRMREKA